jgi:hypothetical protein
MATVNTFAPIKSFIIYKCYVQTPAQEDGHLKLGLEKVNKSSFYKDIEQAFSCL